MNPPMKVDAETLIELWKEIFNIYSFNNPEYNIASLHLVMGTLLKHCRVRRNGTPTDPRISILYLKPTFSGGSAGYDLTAKVLRRLDLKPQKITDTTDAGLIGSIDKRGNFTKGVLDRTISDMVYWGEASILFNRNLPPHQQKTINFFQMALNPIDSEESHFEKPMRDGIVTCDVEASLLAVSFPLSELDERMLISGLLQRMLFIFKTIDLDGRLSNMKEDINRYSSEIDVNDRIDELVIMLKLIQGHYAHGTEFYINSNAIEYFEDAQKDMIESFRNSNQRVQMHIGSFIASNVRKITAIAMHHCAMDFRNRSKDTEITKEDIEYAFEQVIKPQIAMIHEYLEERPEHEVFNNKESTEILKLRKGYEALVRAATGKNISKKAFLEMIGKTLGLTSTKSTYKRYNILKDKDLIEEKSIDDVRFN